MSNGPLRIALVCDWYLPRVGGIETHVSDLARHLAESGHTVDVLTTNAGRDRRVPVRTPHGVRIVRLGLTLLPPGVVTSLPFEARTVRDVLRDGAYDVVHCHTSTYSPLAWAATYYAQREGTPCVLTHHSVFGATRWFALLDRLFGWTRWPVLYSSVSPYVAGQMRTRLRVPHVRVLPNAVHPGEWTRLLAARSSDDIVEIVSVMRLAPRKRPRALVAIARRVVQLLDGRVRVRFRVAGDGRERAETEQAIDALGMRDTVELLGWRPRSELPALYAASDVFVLPSRLESFGIAALEARCAGLPVVAMRDAGPAGFIHHEREGLLASDDEDFARQIVRLVTDRALRDAIARHNRETLPAETWDAVLARHDALYRELLAGGVSASTNGPLRALAGV